LLDGLPPPLTRAPGLEPALQIPPFWPAVCERRGRLHEDALEYVLAWCTSRSGKLEDLADALARARHTTVRADVEEAAAEDLANLAAEGVAVRMDPRVAEYLAAIHLFRDNPREALAVLDFGRRRGAPPPAEGCERTVLRLLAQFDRRAVDRLAEFVGTRCLRGAELMLCAGDRALRSAKEVAERDSVSGMCGGRVMTDAEIRRVRLAETYWRWTADEPAAWPPAIRAAIDAMSDVPGSEELAVSTLELAVDTQCRPEVDREANEDVKLMASSPAHDPRYDDRLAQIAKRMAPCISGR
jgi:hypothetical protein